MLGVGSRDEQGALENFVSRFGAEGFEHIADLDGEVWEQFDVSYQPAFVFIDDDGTASTPTVGSLDVERLRERMAELADT